jgi:hypothetical protein
VLDFLRGTKKLLDYGVKFIAGFVDTGEQLIAGVAETGD